MVTSLDNTGTWVASDIVYIETTSPDQDINRKELYYYCSADGSESIQAATTHSADKLKIVVIRRRHILEVIIKSKTNTEEKFPRSPV